MTGLRVNTPQHIMNDRITLPLVHRSEKVAVGGPGNLYWIVEATAGQSLDLASVKSAPPQSGGHSFQIFPFLRMNLVAVPTFGPIHPSVRSQEWPVDVATVSGKSEFPDQDFLLVGYSISRRILQTPDGRMRSHVNGSFMPQNTLWEDQSIRKDHTLVELPVLIGVF